MRIRCSKSELVKGVNIVMKAIPSKTTMTILECILIIAYNGTITLTANDMELGIDTIITGDIEENGAVALNAKLISDIVRKLPDNTVLIETDENFMTKISCEKSKFNLVGRSGEEFPYPEEVKKDDFITISQFTLREVIKQTIFSIADNDNNKIMTGELFEIKGNTMKVISLDGHRISIRNIELRQEYPDKKVIVPGKTLSEIEKILSGEIEKTVNIYFTQSNAVFEFDNTVVTTRLIEGEYFNIDQMMSDDYETKVVINKKEFIDSIERAILLVKDNDKKPVILSIENDVMEIKINSTIGSMNEDINIDKEGFDLMIGFNPKFILDALRVIDDESISLYFMNSKAPCFIKEENDKYTYLILPVNFNNVG
ncbi:MAG: DNA polymerase III subunit beta [Lachnospiraceae bacterium]|nr:DNA polymerase III subunit beta [Lachnospiraceae bacterium]